MNEEIEEYIRYLESFNEIKRPILPNYDLSAYTDNEYLNAIENVMNDYESIDDLWVTLDYLKGN